MNTPELLQFGISHYAEKARWALEFKGIEHTKTTLLPGAHILRVKRLTGKTTVPVLLHNGRAIRNSSAIISYLDAQFSAKQLTPKDPKHAEEALEWERFADKELGPHVRRYCYHYLLERPDDVIPLIGSGTSPMSKRMLKFGFPILRKLMRKSMNINPKSAERSKQKIDSALNTIQQKLTTRESAFPYLVGDQFSRADLAVCALLAPLTRPEQYGVPWPTELPTELENAVEQWAQPLDWVRSVYEKHR